MITLASNLHKLLGKHTIRLAPPPTGKYIATLFFKDDPETHAQHFDYTFPRAGPDSLCHGPRFVPLWSPASESLQYSSLFFNGKSSWSPGSYKEIPFKNSRVQVGINLDVNIPP